MIDDAHGIGVLGANGRGIIECCDVLPSDVQVLIGTFGKAFGTFGAFVAGSRDLIESLIQFARTCIYTTSLPPAIVEATRASLRIIKKENWRRDYLHTLIKSFNKKAQHLNLSFSSSLTPIQPLIIGDAIRAEKIANYLRKKGIFISSVRPPTVPTNTARLRVGLTVDHTEEQINYLLESLKEIFSEKSEGA